MRKGLIIAIAAFMVFVGVQSANAATVPITVDGEWHGFSFGSADSPWDTLFTFTLTGTATMTVTDAYLSGDQFEVFNFGDSIGLTSMPTTQGSGTSDFDYAAANPQWSTGVWVFGPGSYSISGIAVLSPYGSGGAGLMLESGGSAVPLPGAVWLLGSGLLGLAGFRKKLMN